LTAFAPRNPDYEACVRDSFARQHFMTLIGAVISRVVPGEVDIELPNQLCLTQQHGFFHAGATSSIADSAAGYAALSLFAPGNGVLTTEFKINLLAPAKGDKLIAWGRVIKTGRTLTICKSDVVAIDDGSETSVATALLTMMQIKGLEG
jgi:uncharacterized protein (TIGR00369 family)